MTSAKILVVEDEDVVALDLKARLERLGYTVLAIVPSGEEAIRQAATLQPDLVLMDIHLAGEMDGIQAAEHLRARLDIPVIYLTAYADDETLERATASEPFGYLVKPFQERELRSTIEMALYQHQVEKRLRENEARYRIVSELSSDYAYSTRVLPDGSRRYEWATEGFTRITGFTVEELQRHGRWRSLVHPDDMTLAAARVERLYSGEPDVSEFRIITKSGEVRWLRDHGRPLWDEGQGRVVGVYGAAQDITERKRMEAALRESEQKYRALVENISDVVYALDEQALVTYVSPSIEPFLGYTPAEMIGQHFTKFVYPDDLPRIRENVQRILNEVPPLEPTEYRILSKSGQVRWMRTSSKAILAEGRVVGLRGVLADVTGRKQVEEALQQSERKYRSIVEQSPDGIVLTDERGGVIEWNRGAEQITGLAQAEVLGRPIWDVQFQVLPEEYRTPDQYEQVQAVFDDLMATGRMPERYQLMETEIQLPDGSRRLLQSMSFPLSTDRGFRLGGILRDVTDLQQTQEALRESEERHTALFETMAQGVVYQNREGEIILANLAAQKILGLTLAQMQGRTSLDPRWQAIKEDGSAFPGEEHPAMVALETGQTVENVLMGVFNPQLDEVRWISIDATPLLRLGEDRPYQVYTIFSDITAQRRAEAERVQLAVEQEKVKILAGFVEAASHEFRTPLSVINASLYLLERATPPEQRQRHAQAIQAQVDYIHGLVQDMLTLSRLDSSPNFAFAPLDVNNLLRDMQTRMHGHAEAKGVVVTLELTDAPPVIQADEQELHVALSKLVENAVQHTPRGGTVTLRTETRGEHAIVEVGDTGSGISEEDLPHVFERFYRGDKARTSRGAGLGLSIAQKIVEAHGGTVEVESVEGRGSTFKVRLPLAVGPSDR